MTFDAAWRELVQHWYPDDSFRPSRAIRQYYETKWRIVEPLRPTRILEIGVRAGYSAFVFMRAACRGAKYLGIDSGLCDAEARQEYLAHARKLLDQFDARLWVTSTASLRAFPYAPAGERWELVHVDGDHGYAGCLHDLRCAADVSTRILVDDYDTGPEIRRACTDFLAGGGWAAKAIPDGGVAGNLLLTRT